MNDTLIVALAARRGRGLDQPDLADQLTAQNAWQAWTPLEELIELPRDAEALIDATSAELGHFHPAGPQRHHAWECAQAAAWGLTQPVPRPILPARVQATRPPHGWRPHNQLPWHARPRRRTTTQATNPDQRRSR